MAVECPPLVRNTLLSKPIAIIHTSPATIDVFGPPLREQLPGRQIINILDDSILPELHDNGGRVDAVLPRWRDYARIARDCGADLILNACSSIGALCEPVEAELGLPIVRVDTEMARAAIASGTRIAVAATLATTLQPTTDNLVGRAERAGKTVQITPVLVEGAYPALMRGDRARHDDLLAAALERMAETSDVVVLAQASMARVLPCLTHAPPSVFLTSPPFAVEDVVSRVRLIDA
jgi:Asp/Glu/hydantoin racemase